MSVRSIDRPSSATAVWRSSRGLWLVTAAVGLLSLCPFWDGLQQLWMWWQASPDDNFGMLIPPIAAFLVWQQKDRLERIAFTGSWWGLLVILLGGALLFLGQLGTIFALVQYASVVTLCGVALSFLGWPAFRIIAIPLMTLLFMVPFPQFVMANLSTALQLLSSEIGVYLMRLADISVFLEGNVIDLGGYKLEVAEACSGLRYLFPLMTLGFLIAYFYKGALWKRIVLFLSSIPITVLMNSVRIGIIGVTVEHWGVRMAEGFLHEFQGWMIFMVSTALIVLEMIALNRVGHVSGANPRRGNGAKACATDEFHRRRRVDRRLRAELELHSEAGGGHSGTRRLLAISPGFGALARPARGARSGLQRPVAAGRLSARGLREWRRRRRGSLCRLVQLAAQG